MNYSNYLNYQKQMNHSSYLNYRNQMNQLSYLSYLNYQKQMNHSNYPNYQKYKNYLNYINHKNGNYLKLVVGSYLVILILFFVNYLDHVLLLMCVDVCEEQMEVYEDRIVMK